MLFQIFESYAVKILLHYYLILVFPKFNLKQYSNYSYVFRKAEVSSELKQWITVFKPGQEISEFYIKNLNNFYLDSDKMILEESFPWEKDLLTSGEHFFCYTVLPFKKWEHFRKSFLPSKDIILNYFLKNSIENYSKLNKIIRIIFQQNNSFLF